MSSLDVRCTIPSETTQIIAEVCAQLRGSGAILFHSGARTGIRVASAGGPPIWPSQPNRLYNDSNLVTLQRHLRSILLLRNTSIYKLLFCERNGVAHSPATGGLSAPAA